MPENGEPNNNEEEGIAPAGVGQAGAAGAAVAGTAATAAGGGTAVADRKLIPEWDVEEDDQVLAAGLAVLLAMIGLFAWTTWRGGDDSPLDEIVPVTAEAEEEEVAAATTTTEAPTTTEAAAETTVPEALDLTPDVQAAAGPFGATGFAEDETAILEGFVGNDGEFSAAEEAAAAVPGIISVDNRLVILQPSVQAALEADGVGEAAPTVEGTVATAIGVVGNEGERDSALAAAGEVEGVTEVIDRLRILQPDVLSAITDAGVTGPGAEVTGTVATVTGVIASEDDRAPSIEAAAAVPGVTEVIDELTVRPDVAGDLNALFELDPIQFATGSATILDVSFPTLDEAAAILADNPDVTLEVQGYTDTRGGDDANLALSQARADSVRAYLISQGVGEDTLTSVGYGETTQFGEGETPEALAANRRVQFEQR